MIYPYRCPKCSENIDRIKPVSECSMPEYCDKCGTLLDRVFSMSNGFVRNKDGWNPGLSCRQRDVGDKIRKLKYEQGRDIVEVGNEKPTKETRDGYKFTDREIHDMHNMLGE